MYSIFDLKKLKNKRRMLETSEFKEGKRKSEENFKP